MDKQSFYLQEKSEEIVKQEQQYEKLPCSRRKFGLSASAFLNMVREIVFFRKKGLPTKQKEKILRQYRDYDVNNR